MKDAVIHNPVDGIISAGTIDVDSDRIAYDHPILNTKVKAQLKEQFKAGKISQDKAVFGGYTSEYEGKLPEYLSFISKNHGKYKLAGLGTNVDFSSLDKVVVLNEVLNVQFRIYSLPEAIRQIATPDTVLKVDQATTFNAYQAVNEGASVDPNHQSYTRTAFTLPKDIAFFGLTDEAQYRFSHPLFQLHVDNTARALRAAWNSQIATVMEGGTTTAGSTWDTISSGLSSNNPFVDVNAVQNTIISNGGQPFTMAMHETVWQGFVGNTFVRGAYNNNREPIQAGARQQMADLLGGVTIFIDNGLTSTKATVYDFNQYAVCANGPTVAFQWRDYNRDADMYKIEHYHQEQRIVTGKGRVLTGVHS